MENEYIYWFLVVIAYFFTMFLGGIILNRKK